MLLFRSDPFGGTHELLPCGLLGGDLVKLFRKNKSKYYWYDLTVRGERYRGSTKETNQTRAQKAAALKLAATIKGSDPLDRKPPTLREYSKVFLQWLETGRLEADSRSPVFLDLPGSGCGHSAINCLTGIAGCEPPNRNSSDPRIKLPWEG